MCITMLRETERERERERKKKTKYLSVHVYIGIEIGQDSREVLHKKPLG